MLKNSTRQATRRYFLVGAILAVCNVILGIILVFWWLIAVEERNRADTNTAMTGYAIGTTCLTFFSNSVFSLWCGLAVATLGICGFVYGFSTESPAVTPIPCVVMFLAGSIIAAVARRQKKFYDKLIRYLSKES